MSDPQRESGTARSVVERIAQQLRPYMSDEDAEKATEGVLRVLGDR